MSATATMPQLEVADWPAITAELDASGCAVTPQLLTPGQCRELAALYDRPELFRSTIDMARHPAGLALDVPPGRPVPQRVDPAALPARRLERLAP
jgi:hypothetical protein